MLCAGSIFFIVFGLLGIFAKDMIWDLTVWQNQMKGLASERTENWDTMTTISGVVFILLGILSIYAFFQSLS